MDLQTLQQNWARRDEQLDQVLRLNRQHASDIAQLKSQSLLSSMRPIKVFTLVVGIVWVILLNSLLIAGFRQLSPYFLVSMGIQSLLTTIAIVVYVYQLLLLQRTDLSEPIFWAQAKIARLQTSTLWVTRILVLQLPVWTTFHLHERMLREAAPGLLMVQGSLTLLFLLVALWLFANIRLENKDKRWFRLLFQGKEWTPLMQAMALLDEVEAAEKVD